MEQGQIAEGNKIIAEFMEKRMTDSELEAAFDDALWHESELEYHSSWDWFHPAFDKFKTMQLKQWEGDGVTWNHKYSFHLCRIGAAMVHSTILDAFEKLSEAIQWYNKNKNP